MTTVLDQQDALREELAIDCAHLSALQARVGRRLVEIDDTGAWGGEGIRSLEHWASMALGLAPAVTRSLVATTRSLAVLPDIEAAMLEGRLSFDKVRAIVPVATPASQERWATLADQTTVTQLQRITAAYRRVDPDGSGDDTHDPVEQRRLWWTQRRNGLEQLTALLTPEDAAVVKAALANAVEDQWRSTPAEDRAADPAAARAADALAAIAETAMVAGPQPVSGGERNTVNLLIDLELLAGTKNDGICQLEHFSRPVAAAEAELLACDAIIRPIITLNGSPIDVGRGQRLPNRAQRRALRVRDGGCRFPGCGHSRFVQAHHIDHWIRGGPTDLANLILLCPYHHRLHHRGGYTVRATLLPGQFECVDPHGRIIGRPPDPPPIDPEEITVRTGIEPTPLTPHAKDCGTPLDLVAIISGIVDAERLADLANRYRDN